MSIYVASLVRPIEGEVLRPAEKLVLMTLALYADEDGGSIFPSNARLARECCLSRRSVQNYLRSLEDLGILVCVANAGGGRGTRRSRLDLAQLKALHPRQADGMGRTSGERAAPVTPFPRQVTPFPHDGVQPASSQGCNQLHPRGATSFTPGVQLASPDSSVERSKEKSGERERARAQAQEELNPERRGAPTDSGYSRLEEKFPTLEALVITPEIEVWAQKHAPPWVDLVHELEGFRCYCAAHGRTHDDYGEGFCRWLLKVRDFTPRRSVPPASASRQPGASPIRRQR